MFLNLKVAVITALLASSSLAVGSDPTQEPTVSITPRNSLRSRTSSRPSNLKAGVTMVMVPVTVTDTNDWPVTDLSGGAFRVFEDNKEQHVVSFHREDGPVSVGFIFDASSSMKKRMDRSIAAVQQFLSSSIPGDEFFLISFSERPEIRTKFTVDPDDILGALRSVEPYGWTALNDAICLGMQQMKKREEHAAGAHCP